MNIDEIDIFDYFHKGFENDLKRINKAEPYYPSFPYIMRDLNACNDLIDKLYNWGI